MFKLNAAACNNSSRFTLPAKMKINIWGLKYILIWKLKNIYPLYHPSISVSNRMEECIAMQNVKGSIDRGQENSIEQVRKGLYLPHIRKAYAQTSLRKHAVLREPLVLSHSKKYMTGIQASSSYESGRVSSIFTVI